VSLSKTTSFSNLEGKTMGIGAAAKAFAIITMLDMENKNGW
jgi:hypothetical protein